jgi:hypothetical protein
MTRAHGWNLFTKPHGRAISMACASPGKRFDLRLQVAICKKLNTMPRDTPGVACRCQILPNLAENVRCAWFFLRGCDARDRPAPWRAGEAAQAEIFPGEAGLLGNAALRGDRVTIDEIRDRLALDAD